MSDELTVKEGTKIEPDEAKTLDRNEMGVSQIDPIVEDEVEGQRPYRGLVRCPWCHRVSWCRLNTRYYKWFTCCYCGGSFRA
jgi:transposase